MHGSAYNEGTHDCEGLTSIPRTHSNKTASAARPLSPPEDLDERGWGMDGAVVSMLDQQWGWGGSDRQSVLTTSSRLA